MLKRGRNTSLFLYLRSRLVFQDLSGPPQSTSTTTLELRLDKIGQNCPRHVQLILSTTSEHGQKWTKLFCPCLGHCPRQDKSTYVLSKTLSRTKFVIMSNFCYNRYIRNNQGEDYGKRSRKKRANLLL